MAALRLLAVLGALGLGVPLAWAQCVSSDDIDRILGVAPDGRIVYTNETRRDLLEGGEESGFELQIVLPSGEPETTITRTARGDWQLRGRLLPPAVLAGTPSPSVLGTRVATLLGATEAPRPLPRDVRIVKGDAVYRVFVDRALVKLMRVGDPADDPGSERSWRAQVLMHPRSRLLFLALQSHTQPRPRCKVNVESIDWFAPGKLDPDDKSVATTFCKEQLTEDEAAYHAPPSAPGTDDAYDRSDPLAAWLACTKDAFGGTYLGQAAAQAARLEAPARRRLVRAVAHTVETAWAPLATMAASKSADERTFALEVLTRIDAALRRHEVHGARRDPVFRATLVTLLKRLCARRSDASRAEAAAIAACEAELAEPAEARAPDEEACHPGACAQKLVGVAPDGRFVVEATRGNVAFELRAPDGRLQLRISDNCTDKKCEMRWDLDGVADSDVLELTTSDPKPSDLRANLQTTLGLTAPQPSTRAVTLVGNTVRIGLWAVATVEDETRSQLQPLEHEQSRLLFVDTTSPNCREVRCHQLVWGPRPVAAPNDFTALEEQCQKRSDAGERAECLGSIFDERVFPILLQFARSDDSANLGEAAARVATALGRHHLIDYATSPDAFRRQWAVYALAQVLEDTTERLPFTGRAPDKRRPALIAEIEPVCTRRLADRDLVVAGAALRCLAQTSTKLDGNRLREVLHSPLLDARAAVFAVAVREGLLAGAELPYVAGWLKDPIDKKQPDYQEWLHGEVCGFFVTRLDPTLKKSLRPLVEARVKTLHLRPEAKGACQTLLGLL